MRVVETEDEHAEARFVAAEIARAGRGGLRASREIAVVYRTNAQSRVLEDVLVRQGVDYQVIGGPRFYERAEIKDAIAYLQVIDNPYRRRLAARGSRTGRGAASATRRSRGCRRFADGHRRSRSGTRSAAPRRPASRPRRCGRCSRSAALLQSLMATAHGRDRRRARRGGARAHRLPRGARGRADDRGARPDREPRGARRRRARVQYAHGAARSRRSRSFLQEISLLLRPGRARATTTTAARSR